MVVLIASHVIEWREAVRLFWKGDTVNANIRARFSGIDAFRAGVALDDAPEGNPKLVLKWRFGWMSSSVEEKERIAADAEWRASVPMPVRSYLIAC